MPDRLLTMKLYAPPLRPGLVRRPRLLQKMDQGLRQGSLITLISAPAGYGKTTLALEWLKSLNRPYGWLSLDRGDNHPVQFLTYLAAALQQVIDPSGEPLIAALDLSGSSDYRPEWIQSQLTELINRIAAVKAPFVLLLDDYHTITDLAIHQALEFLLDHQPAQMHLLITTRQDPMLPLSRLRSRGQATEIRLGDLRFTREETGTFLNETMGLGLIVEQIASLESRTEGWIAGLQLAALSLSQMSDWSQTPLDAARRSSFIDAFTGDDHHVMDYLMDEVLSRQPDQVQQFLLQTSILKRLCGPLCDAVLGDRGQGVGDHRKAVADLIPSPLSPLPFSSSQKILEYLEKANLFIIPLDNHREWYRYHHLFADLLSSRLQSSNPGLVSALHCRASRWYEGAGLIPEAVDHALLAEDFDRALQLIEHTARTSIWASGDLPVLLNWSRRLPEDVLITRPGLCLYYARALFFSGQLEAAESYLQSAERALRGRADAPAGELWGVYFTNRATFAAMRGDSQAALEFARQAQPLVTVEDISTHARIAHAVGMAEYLLGNVREAEQAFSQAVQLTQKVNNRNLGLDVVACLALTLILSGRLRQAARVCQDALDADAGNRTAPAACAVHLALAQVGYEQNQLQEACSSLDTCIELGWKAGWKHVLWQAYVLQAQIQQALGNFTAAMQALQKAEQVAQDYPIPHVFRYVSTCRLKIELAAGEAEQAASSVEEYQDLARISGGGDFEALTAARLLLAKDRIADALAQIDRVLHSAQAGGRVRSVIEALLLRSVANGMIGDSVTSLEALAKALTLAEPEGFARLFLNEGRPVADLLSQARQWKAAGPIAGFASKLLADIAEPDCRPGKALNPSPPHAGLFEPLSERELEVLKLIGDGLTNPEIAARLYLSVNTLRAHSANIFRKLEVHNRVQAVARGRELGLLSDV